MSFPLPTNYGHNDRSHVTASNHVPTSEVLESSRNSFVRVNNEFFSNARKHQEEFNRLMVKIDAFKANEKIHKEKPLDY